MLPLFRRQFLFAALFAGATLHAPASPFESKLLPLIPEGAQIVAGIEDPHNPHSSGRLLLVTHNTNLDFNDWIALTGVDPHRMVDEVIEVATSSPHRELADHLVLVAGSFDQSAIFRAAKQNGSFASKYSGEDVLVVEPLARERQQMLDTRWMAIVNDRIAVFGIPRLVKEALDRFARKATADPVLLARLGQLRPDVNSWNVLAMSAPMLVRHVDPGQLHAPWTHILDGADELTLGIHYGSRARIDFAVHNVGASETQSMAATLAQVRVVRVDESNSLQPRLENIAIDGNRVHGSVVVPGKQFDAWLAEVCAGRSVQANSH